MIGALLFLFFIATFHSTYISSRLAATWMDTAVFAIFLVCALFCLVCSATYHLSTCHSQVVSELYFNPFYSHEFVEFSGYGSLSFFRLCWHRHPHCRILLPVYILWVLLRACDASLIPYSDNYDRSWSVSHKSYKIHLILIYKT